MKRKYCLKVVRRKDESNKTKKIFSVKFRKEKWQNVDGQNKF